MDGNCRHILMKRLLVNKNGQIDGNRSLAWIDRPLCPFCLFSVSESRILVKKSQNAMPFPFPPVLFRDRMASSPMTISGIALLDLCTGEEFQ